MSNSQGKEKFRADVKISQGSEIYLVKSKGKSSPIVPIFDWGEGE